MNENPWIHLPTEPPYVLPKDKEVVELFNRSADARHVLQVDKLLPEAFVGARDAPVVLLSNNPGFKDEEVAAKQDAAYCLRMRRNLIHESADYPFCFLHPDFIKSGNVWWKQRLKPLIDRFGDRIVARSVLNIVYSPYPSNRFGHGRIQLPSKAQEYSFGLVRDALERKAAVVLLRSGKGNQEAWLRAVPGLKEYDRFYCGSNPQAPYISPKNCPGFFEQIVEAIAAFKKQLT
jgi:hypothetical protein